MVPLSVRLSFQARIRRAAWPILAVLLTGASAELRSQQPASLPDFQDRQTTADIRADSQERDKNVYHLHGHVVVTYRDMKLTADEASFNEFNGDVRAVGNVTFKDSTSRLEADEAFYNMQTGMGWFSNGRGALHAKVSPRPRMLITPNPFYVRARRLERRNETTYVAFHAHVTTCDCEATGWSISTRRARIEVGDKVVTHYSLFRLLRIPIFYTPATVNSIARRPRQTGFLLPHIGNSSQKGLILGGGFFWAINPSADLLLGLANYSIRGLARYGRFHAVPSATSDLFVEYSGMNDKGGGPQRQSRAPGQSLRVIGEAKDVGGGFRGVLNVDYITSLAYRLTFTDNFMQAVTSEVHQTGFLTKNFDAYSLNFFASRYQNFLTAQLVPGNSIIIRQTPGVDFSGMDRQVGNSSFYFAFDFSAAGVGRTQPGFVTPQLSTRLDFHPEITLRTKPFLGFHFTPTLGLDATHYGTSLNAPNQGVNRLLGDFSVDLRPPSFEKVFARPHWGRRFKHVIEPDIRYRLVRAHDAENLLDVVRYDRLDILAETNEIEYSLTNSLLSRKETSKGEKPQARELISWRISQKYYFDPTFGGALVPGQRVVFDPTISLTGFAFAQGRRLSPIVSVLKLAPSSHYDTELRADMDPAGGGVLNAGITSNLRRGPAGLSFTDFFINRTAALSTPIAPTGSLAALPSFHLLGAMASYGNSSRKGFSGAIGLNYNLAQRIAHQVVSQLSYNFGCLALDFEFLRFALGTLRRENQFRIAISLANMGSFGNLKPRERLY